MLQRKTSVAAGLKAALTVGAWLVVATQIAGCGQKGPLFIPTDPTAQNRATLSETIRPAAATPPASPASAPPATGTASPLPTTP